jgi:hypothetical protein
MSTTREKLEKVVRRHNDPESSLNVEVMLDEMMPVIDSERAMAVEEDRRMLMEKILEDTKWAEGRPEDEDRDWRIHYEGYLEARKDILALLSTSNNNK